MVSRYGRQKSVKYYVQFMSSTQREFYLFLVTNSWEWVIIEAESRIYRAQKIIEPFKHWQERDSNLRHRRDWCLKPAP